MTELYIITKNTNWLISWNGKLITESYLSYMRIDSPPSHIPTNAWDYDHINKFSFPIYLLICTVYLDDYAIKF